MYLKYYLTHKTIDFIINVFRKIKIVVKEREVDTEVNKINFETVCCLEYTIRAAQCSKILPNQPNNQ